MYIRKKLLGKGAYGKVYLVLNDKDQKYYALKSLEKNKNCLIAFDTEINLLKKLDHENIIKLHDFYENKQKLNIILEYAENGTLGNVISQNHKFYRKFKNDDIKNIVLSISNGLNHLHKYNIIHRDIKPENILISANNTYKISDFGVSRLDNNTRLINTSIGTPYYMSPELIKGKTYNKSVDYWALGCVFYELFTLSPPFTGNNMYVLSARVCRGSFSLHQLPLDYRPILKSLIEINKKKRGTTYDVITFYENLEKEDIRIKSRIREIKQKKELMDNKYLYDNANKYYKNKEYVSPNKNKEYISPNKNKEYISPYKNKEYISPNKNKEYISPYKNKEYISPNKYNNRNNQILNNHNNVIDDNNLNKFNILPEINNGNKNIIDYRKKKYGFKSNKQTIQEYYKNRKFIFY